MKSERSLWNSITFLIGAVIAILAFVRGGAQVWLLLGAFTLWGAWVVGTLLLPLLKKVKKARQRKAMEKTRCQEGHGESAVNGECPESAAILLMRHVNLRITGFLRSIYEGAAWEWCEKDPEKLVLCGGIGRIRVYGVEDYDHADVKVDRRGNITCSMVKSVPLESIGIPDAEFEELPPNKQPVNTQIWYEMQGRKILEKAIADLNSRGYTNLTIREDGDVLIEEGTDGVPLEHLSNFPAKVYWPQLLKVFQGEGMAAQIGQEGIQLTW